MRGDADVMKDVPTKRYIKRLEFAERRSKPQGNRLDLLKEFDIKRGTSHTMAGPAGEPGGGHARRGSFPMR